MKQTSFSLGLVACMISMSSAVEIQSADALVAKGHALHSARKYGLAAEAFGSAIKLDSCPASTHYLLARSLAMDSPDREKWDETSEQACDALAMAIHVDPEAAREAASDWDFIHIRVTPRFQALIGADLRNPDWVKLLLFANAIWYSPPHGVWNGSDLYFLQTGEVRRRMFVIDEQDKYIIRFESGRYEIGDEGGITITFTSGELLRAKFVKDGTLALKGEETTNYTCYPIHDV